MASSIAGKKKSQITKVQWNNFADFATPAQKKYYETYGVIPDDYVEPTAAQTQALARGQYSAAYASLANQGKTATSNSTTSNSLAGKTAKDLTRVEVYDFLNNATPEELDYYYGHHTNEKGEEVANGIPSSYVPKQNYTFWNAGNSTIGDYGIDDSNSDTWKRIQALYNSGDVNGAYDLINGMADKGQFGGYYDDNGQYWGFAQGYLGGANSSYLPVVGGKILSNKGLDTTGTNIWLTPDGKALHADANGALSDTGDTWSKYQNTDIARTQLKMLDDADASLAAFIEQNGGRYPEAPTPTQNANGGLTYSYGGGNGTIYQQMLGQTGNSGGASGGTSGGASGGTSGGTSGGAYPTQQPTVSTQQYIAAPAAYDPNSSKAMQDFNATYGIGTTPQWEGGTYSALDNTMYKDYLDWYENNKAPEYAGDPYQAQRDAALEAYGQKWEGSQYQPLRDQYLQNAANMKWSYNPDTDPVWQAYQKQYRREGQRATEDTLGRVAGMTGGMPSSYAVTAASQAGNYYASQLSDKLPQLYRDAYNRYLQEYQRQLGLSDAYAQFDNTEYTRWLQGQQQNLDLANAYNLYGQQDYEKYRDSVDDYNNNVKTRYQMALDNIGMEQGDWERKYGLYKDELDRYNKDRDFYYGVGQDDIANGRQAAEDQYKRYLDEVAQQNYINERLQYLKEYADSQNWKEREYEQYLREYGDKLSQQEREWVYKQMQAANDQALDLAKLGAQYGDYSGLSGLGVDTSSMNQPTYAYSADGTTYDIGSYKGKTFIESAPAGSTMTGVDGSKWTKNADGSVIIQKNGKTFVYGQQAQQAQSGTPYKAPPLEPPEEPPKTGGGNYYKRNREYLLNKFLENPNSALEEAEAAYNNDSMTKDELAEFLKDIGY